ncbi:putative amino acid ABC transporter, permease protein [Gordonia spumicola]|uniref:Putative amino acid ABC transporter, permease protein n=1 Tax=Gordonia spumicola TaxID=589161 RepID=A0A7I9VC90_9ACTN|nr:amino acid ABC transporter permease [Gordonia spumicola]GEE02751.1 putative amino acid ABC transporter, permease protein [Gordonia spumicola]
MTAVLSPSPPVPAGTVHRPGDDELLAAKVLPARHPWQWVGTGVVLVLTAMLVHTLVTNERFQWDVVGDYFTSSSVLRGLWLTLWLTGATMVVGFAFGVVLAAMRLSSSPILSSISFGYVWLIRSVPPLVQLLFWFQLASLFPQLSLGVPFGPSFVTFDTATLITGVVAAFIALTLDVAAFSAEIVRGGLLSVDEGQTEAAASVGLTRARIFWRIVLPQAMPAIIPSTGNLLIGLLKATSIVSVIAVEDLLYSTQLIYQQNYLVIPLLLVATVWYIILTTILSIGQYFVERHYTKGRRRRPPSSFAQVFRDNLPLFGRIGRHADSSRA